MDHRDWRWRSWPEGVQAHAAAVGRFIAAARSVPDPAWRAAPAPGKWSPAEITMHLVLTYHHLLGEQEGTLVIRVLPSPWKAWLLRRTILPRLLGGQPFPAGVRAPREVRPGAELPDVEPATRALEAATTGFEAAAGRNFHRGVGRATHPFFGPLQLPQMLRFAELHADHHRRQILAAVERPA